MTKAFRSFMKHLIDYAGLFPPADLDLNTALTNYGNYLHGEYSDILGSFIVPCTKLQAMNHDPLFRYSVLVSPAAGREEIEQLRMYADNIQAIEICLPPAQLSPVDYQEQLSHIEQQLDRADLSNIVLFIESVHLEEITAAMVSFREGNTGKAINKLGYKLRCGGMKSSAFPSPERVAEVIAVCRAREVPVKFTAGMHQPLRNYSERHQTMQNGFLNIVGAALLHWADQLNVKDMIRMLAEQDAGMMNFSDEGFGWNSHFITTDTIKLLREEKVLSFGSCSFDEPLAALEQLGLLNISPSLKPEEP